ncbi:MAG: hypothetical protein A2075_06090 [Geobacteraceae bacterium GWC2_58_44]|nr:MAG: hypothetical protein A2075_06090 [Geobacteraceae bacterium GWC2_58_44]HBG05733.1 hypothetical protein [Geobacter sp.]
MKNDAVIKIGFVVAVAILASIMFMSHSHLSQWKVLDQRELYTFSLIRKMDSLLHGLKEVRRSQRGYSRTGKEEYLKSYLEARGNVERELAYLNGLAADHPRLRRWVLQIEPLVRVKLAERQLALESTAGEDLPKLPGKSRVSTDEIQRQIIAAQDEAIRDLRESSARQVAEMVKVQRLLAAKAFVIFVMICLVFVLLRRDITRRRKSEQQLIEHRDQLDQLVQTRTRELEEANQQLHLEIRERERSDALLQQAHHRLVDTLESMTDGFVSLDRQWRYTYVNAAAARLMGRSAAELLGQVCWEMFPGSEESVAYCEIRRAMAENRCVDFEDFRGGSLERWYENRCYPSPEGMTIYFTDVTQRKWAEQTRRDLSEHLDRVREEERLAISREVHDGIGQSLTALQLDLSWMERRFAPEQLELAARLQEMHAGLDQLIEQVQHITAELRPPLLDNLGLAAAIEWQAGEFGRRSGIDCHLMLNEGIEVSSQQAATNLMRIFQEALTNIIRHARCSEVCISLCERADSIILEISDDGCGITAEAIDSTTAYGIMGMRERARLCRGGLSIKGEPGQGTTVTLEIPLNAVKEES